jgi:hypothetical protein
MFRYGLVLSIKDFSIVFRVDTLDPIRYVKKAGDKEIGEYLVCGMESCCINVYKIKYPDPTLKGPQERYLELVQTIHVVSQVRSIDYNPTQ